MKVPARGHTDIFTADGATKIGEVTSLSHSLSLTLSLYIYTHSLSHSLSLTLTLTLTQFITLTLTLGDIRRVRALVWETLSSRIC
jgi:hypothetical protein